MIIKWCATFVAILAIAICVYWHFEHYRNYKSRCVSKISFQKFLEIFETSQHKIHLDDGHFYYSPDPFGIAYGLYFLIPDTFRYEHWRKTREHKLEEDNKNYKMNELEKAWKKDIERYREKEVKNGS